MVADDCEIWPPAERGLGKMDGGGGGGGRGKRSKTVQHLWDKIRKNRSHFHLYAEKGAFSVAE